MSWQKALQESLRTAEDLVREGLIPAADAPNYSALLSQYRFLLPRYYANLIDRQDPRCPIRLQAIPDLRELETTDGFYADPLEDLEHQPEDRVTHRYQKRLLIHLTQNCSMFCRFCFRKTLLNEKRDELFEGSLASSLAYVGQHPEVEEVIFSGGDPFMASASLLKDVLCTLEGISHVERVRFHTRVPVTFPERIDSELVETVTSTRFKPIIVCHFNHPKELTDESERVCRTLADAGSVLLNQSVLLCGVNDDASVLASLSRALFRGGILPYYLHHPDRAQGTAHFDITPEVGLRIHNELRAELPGYLVPKYVVDKVKRPFKTYVGE